MNRRTLLRVLAATPLVYFFPSLRAQAAPAPLQPEISTPFTPKRPLEGFVLYSEHNLVRQESGAILCTNPGCQAWALGGVTLGIDEPCPITGDIDHVTRYFQDVWVMMEAISAFTKETGAQILVADHPEHVIIGRPPAVGYCAFVDSGHTNNFPGPIKSIGWSITIADLAKSLKNPDTIYAGKPTTKIQREMVTEYFKTQKGRKTVAHSFPGQRWVRDDMMYDDADHLADACQLEATLKPDP